VLGTSDGLILFDANQSETEVREQLEPGLRAIELDPADIEYAIIAHGHWDHYGGAKYLQERYATRVGLSAADGDMLDRAPPGGPERAPIFGADRADRPPCSATTACSRPASTRR
jgi:metallo-beta-lactamase class B